METVYDLARTLEKLTGCEVMAWQYLPGSDSYGVENDAKIRAGVEICGEELDLDKVLDGDLKPTRRLALCVFREDFELGEPPSIHLYEMSPAADERLQKAGKSSSSFGDMFVAGLPQ